MALSTSDIILLAIVGVGAIYFLFKDSLFASKPAIASTASGTATPKAAEASTGRDFVAALKQAKKRLVIFYGSQTGTAEDYALRMAKEAKSRFGVSSLVCDPEEYDFENLDELPEDTAIIFSVATYGEGEPTDNAVQFMEFIRSDDAAFSNGGKLDGVKYVVFALGNRTYEQFCAVGHHLDEALTKHGAQRIHTVGEGDDDKSMEDDYLEWKDGMFEALAAKMGWEEGAGADSDDFKVEEVSELSAADDKVFNGELSQRMLSGTRGVYDAKNPYIAPLKASRELFKGGERNCVHGEFDLGESGIRYQAGDHLGLWPINPDNEVTRWLKLLGLENKKDTVIKVTSLDPALAKVPFPTPCTYDALFRHYIDISALASRQSLASFLNYAPSEQAKSTLQRLSDKNVYRSEVADKSLKLSEVLMLAAGDDYHVDPKSLQPSIWHIPFDRVISAIPRLQPRYYSISSSPKLSPSTIHITAVVLKYQPELNSSGPANGKYVYGVGTNYLLNLKRATNKESLPDTRQDGAPVYRLEGPRDRFVKDGNLCAPIHVRRSNFRLPTSPKIPVVMIGPGTGVAPFRGFVQERVALARKAKERDGPDALKDWGVMTLFYGCRRAEWDYLYEEEWKQYQEELGDRFQLFVAFSREPTKPKTYVQQLLKDSEDLLRESIVEKKGYVYICGDAKSMAKDVEEVLKEMIGKAKGGSKAKEGEAEWKVMKDRNRILLDVWS